MKRGRPVRAGAVEGAGEGAEASEGEGAVDAAVVVAAVAEEEEGIAIAAIVEEAATAAGKRRGTTNRFNFRNGESRKGTPRFFVPLSHLQSTGRNLLTGIGYEKVIKYEYDSLITG